MALNNISKTISFNAQSVDGNDNPLAYMSATVMSSGEISKNYSINNKETYKDNKTTIEADWDEFSEAVDELVELV